MLIPRIQRLRVGTGPAAVMIILLLLLGCGSPTTIPDRRQQLEQTAAAGELDDQYQLGKLYCCGNGPGKSSQKAMQWFCRAATQGHPLAQYELGRIYAARAKVYGSPALRQDVIFGHAWFGLAAQQNLVVAATEREALARDMTDKELFLANQYLREWQTLACPS